MSLYDRDYARAPRGGGASPLSGWSATHWLVAANVAVFLLQRLAPSAGDALALWPRDVLRGRLWQLATSLFCHADLWHLLFNMLFLWWLGSELEALYGPARTLRFYAASGLAASLAYVAGAWLQREGAPAIGASGAIMGVTVLYAFHYPRRQVLIYGIVPVEIRWMAAIYVVMDLSGFLGQGSGVANAAHLGGAAYGAAYALWQRRR